MEGVARARLAEPAVAAVTVSDRLAAAARLPPSLALSTRVCVAMGVAAVVLTETWALLLEEAAAEQATPAGPVQPRKLTAPVKFCRLMVTGSAHCRGTFSGTEMKRALFPL